MKTKLLFIPFILGLILAIACDEETITETVMGSNSITLSGDVSDSFDVESIAALYVEDTLSIFTLMMSPNMNTMNYEDIALLMKESATLPSVGTYIITAEDSDPNAFHATYTVNDTTLYLMTSGTIEITTSSNTKIEGTFDMTGPLFDLTPTTGNELNVVGKFSTTPVEL